MEGFKPEVEPVKNHPNPRLTLEVPSSNLGPSEPSRGSAKRPEGSEKSKDKHGNKGDDDCMTAPAPPPPPITVSGINVMHP